MDKSQIKTVCAWCKRHLSGSKKATHISHGICESCEKKMTIKNPKPRGKAPEHLFSIALDDPFIYQKIIKPAVNQLSLKLRKGKFSKLEWIRIMMNASKAAARYSEKKWGIKFKRSELIRAAYMLAKNAWQQILEKRRK